MSLSRKFKQVADTMSELEDLCSQLLDAIKNEDMEEFMSIKEQMDEICDTDLVDMMDNMDEMDQEDEED
jgi:hypothetical protein